MDIGPMIYFAFSSHTQGLASYGWPERLLVWGTIAAITGVMIWAARALLSDDPK